MKYLIVLLALTTAAMSSITLQYDEFELGDEPGVGHDSRYGAAVWYDLDSLGYSSFSVDSVEIVFEDYIMWQQIGLFWIELWQDTGNHNQPDSMLWRSEMMWAVELGVTPPDWDPFMERFPVEYAEPLSGHVWVAIVCEGLVEVPHIVGQQTGYNHARKLESLSGWQHSPFDHVIRLIGEDASVLEQNTWAAIKANF